MSQKEVYSEEFEDEDSVCGTTSADTSQFIQSDVIEGEEDEREVNESLDVSVSDAMGDGAESIPPGGQNSTQVKENVEAKVNSETASTSKSTSTFEAVDKFFGNFGDDNENAATPDLAEIESIMRKIEKLEKAQSVLETTLNFDYAEGPQNNDEIESKQDLASGSTPAINISEAVSRELESVENLINMEKRIQQISDKTGKNSAPSSVASVGAGDRSFEEVLREYDELEQSVSGDLEDVGKPIPVSIPIPQTTTKSKSNSELSQQKSVVQKSAETSHSISDHLSNFSKASVKTQNTNSKKVKPETSWNPTSSANFTDKFNELVHSELLKQNGVNPEVSTANLLKTQSLSGTDVEIEKYNPRSVYAPKGTNQNSRKKLSAVRNQKSGRGGTGDSSQSGNVQYPPSKMGAGEGVPTLEEIFANSPEIGSGINGLIIDKLKTEISRQEKLLEAYQVDSQKLYGQLKNHQTVWAFEKNQYEEQINSLKTEIATLKVNRLAQSNSHSPLLGTASKMEVERLERESSAKTELITDLKREIFLLRNTQDNRPGSGKKAKAAELSQEKENEYQKTIRNLNKQVRTLQRILYSRDPNAALAQQDVKDSKGDTNTAATGSPKRKNSQVPVLESRINQLEQELAKADSDAKERLKEFQQKLNQIKSKYEDQIQELEYQLSEANKKGLALTPQVNSAAYTAIDELSGKLEKSQSETNHLKSEINRYKRELEVASKNSGKSEALSKYEDRIQEVEHKLAEANRKGSAANPKGTTAADVTIEELTGKLEKSQNEISHWKSEINRYKRELEIAARSTANSAAVVNSKQDSATLSLAIKSFKIELAEKEKEIIKVRKELAELKRTNTNLKREREKYLNSATGVTTANKVLTRAKTDLALKPGKISKIKGATEAAKKPNSAPKAVPETVKILQAALESEREQFERLMEEKKRLIDDQEKQWMCFKSKINELRSKMKAKTVEFLSDEKGESSDVDLCVLEDLRERVLTQNKVIIALKEHISSFKAMEMQLGNWKQEKERLEFRITDLTKRCASAEEMRKPENEILLSLTQKVDDLDSRYQYREKQLDSLLNRLTLRTGGSTSLAAVLSPRLTMMNGALGNHHPMNPISLSPTTSYNLLTAGSLPV